MSSRIRFLRIVCFYCRRQLTPVDSGRGDALTKDHMKPESLGGRRKVRCCFTCNNLKGDLLLEEWFWFMGAFPRWWKLFRNNEQVREEVRKERVRRAYAGEAQILPVRR